MMMQTVVKKAFDLGKTLITANAKEMLNDADVNVALGRHSACDWGDVSWEDRVRNNSALKTSARLFSAYHDSNDTKFWIITEADRSYTTVLLPEDY